MPRQTKRRRMASMEYVFQHQEESNARDVRAARRVHVQDKHDIARSRIDCVDSLPWNLNNCGNNAACPTQIITPVTQASGRGSVNVPENRSVCDDTFSETSAEQDASTASKSDHSADDELSDSAHSFTVDLHRKHLSSSSSESSCCSLSESDLEEVEENNVQTFSEALLRQSVLAKTY